MAPSTIVTGAFGYVGLALLHHLAPRGRVIAIGRPPRVPAPIPAGVEVVHGDASLAADHLGPDAALVHLAGGGGESRCREDPVRAVHDVVLTTQRLARAVREKGARRHLLASTIVVYGTSRDHGAPYAESDDVAPDDLYGSLKLAAENAWLATGGTALRLANVYGAGAGVDVGLQGAVERFARAAASGGELTLYGDGSQRIDYVNVDDVCRAVIACLDAPGSLAPAINVGGGAPCSIAELARTCVEVAGKGTIALRPAPPGKVWPDRSLDIGLARRALGWEPRVGLREGLSGLVELMRRGEA